MGRCFTDLFSASYYLLQPQEKKKQRNKIVILQARDHDYSQGENLAPKARMTLSSKKELTFRLSFGKLKISSVEQVLHR